jgi:hypothetical protein
VDHLSDSLAGCPSQDSQLAVRQDVRVTLLPGPPEDPYSSLEQVQHLDLMLRNLHRLLACIAQDPGTTGGGSAIRQVAMELVPAASSIASSIRVMIREGYLVSALVLFRPLVERIATLCYLAEHQEAINLWREGWAHGSRSSLKTRLQAVMPGGSQGLIDQLSRAVSTYNSMVHGDPTAAQQSLTYAIDGIAHVTDRDFGAPGRVASIAVETGIAVAILAAEVELIFHPRMPETPA